VQILVVVAHIQVEVDRLKAEGRRRVPCQHQMDMGKPILRHGGNLLLNMGFVAMAPAYQEAVPFRCTEGGGNSSLFASKGQGSFDIARGFKKDICHSCVEREPG